MQDTDLFQLALGLSSPWMVTLLFEAFMLTLAKAMPIANAARLLGEHDTRMWRIVEHYVWRAVEKLDLSEVRRIAADETSARLLRGQQRRLGRRDMAIVRRGINDFVSRTTPRNQTQQTRGARGRRLSQIRSDDQPCQRLALGEPFPCDENGRRNRFESSVGEIARIDRKDRRRAVQCPQQLQSVGSLIQVQTVSCKVDRSGAHLILPTEPQSWQTSRQSREVHRETEAPRDRLIRDVGRTARADGFAGMRRGQAPTVPAHKRIVNVELG